jgi:hypothetical protein
MLSAENPLQLAEQCDRGTSVQCVIRLLPALSGLRLRLPEERGSTKYSLQSRGSSTAGECRPDSFTLRVAKASICEPDAVLRVWRDEFDIDATWHESITGEQRWRCGCNGR